tara:strand:- start:210 stop:1289 length:1080 start_codon:yes stop_codon:yes gene_type:complete
MYFGGSTWLNQQPTDLVVLQYTDSYKCNVFGFNKDNINPIKLISLNDEFNNVSLIKNSVYLSEYKGYNKYGFKLSGKTLTQTSLNLPLPFIKKKHSLNGFLSTDVIKLGEFVLVRLRFINPKLTNSITKSGFDVIAGPPRTPLTPIILDDNFVTMQWHYSPDKTKLYVSGHTSPIDNAAAYLYELSVVNNQIQVKTLLKRDHQYIEGLIATDTDIYLLSPTALERNISAAEFELMTETVTRPNHAYQLCRYNFKTKKVTFLNKFKEELYINTFYKNKNQLILSDRNSIFIYDIATNQMIKSINRPYIRDMIVLNDYLYLNQRIVTPAGKSEHQLSIINLTNYDTIQTIQGRFGKFSLTM